MRRVTLRSLWAHKRRLLSTVLSVVLGVSFMSGTFILSTTLDRSFTIAKARARLGYEPKVSLSDGFARTAEWYRQQGLL